MGNRVLKLLRVIAPDGTNPYATTDENAWADSICPHCGASQLLRVATMTDGNYRAAPDLTQWLRCPVCLKGSVLEDGTIYPATMPLSEPDGMPALEASVWSDVRKTLSVGAHTAAVMLCRKILFHIAVEKGLASKDNRNRAPSFEQALKHLKAEGYVTPPMADWVARIKDVGNEANHELTPISKDEALDVATFTEQLLILTYEMPARMRSQSPVAEIEPADPAAEDV